jgi:hypothetical protein
MAKCALPSRRRGTSVPITDEQGNWQKTSDRKHRIPDTIAVMKWLGTLLLLAIAGCGEVTTSVVDAAPDTIDATPGCMQGFDDCNSEPADGCEADLSSTETCGSCSNACITPTGGTSFCGLGMCDFTCDIGLIRCDTECLARCDSTFTTAGETQFTVLPGCSRIRIKAWGAGGGNGSANTLGAAGGFASVEVDSVPGNSILVVVGGPGLNAPGQGPGMGGVPGGGNGGSSNSQGGGGGGGFSGVFTGGAIDATTAIVIAGGGGGSGGGNGGQRRGGAGGGTDGQASTASAGGTQTTGFASLMGGNGGSQGSGDGGGGGGGGWFGGFGGNGANSDAFGGGGGSGYARPSASTPVLTTGSVAVPGNDGDADRGSAGEPGAAGLVVIDCL